MTELEKKQTDEKSKLARKHRHELKEEKIKLDTKKHLAMQSVKQECKNKYDFEETKVEAHLQELQARKSQLMSQ